MRLFAGVGEQSRAPKQTGDKPIHYSV